MKYIGFEDLQDIKKEFDSDCDNITDDEVLFASYGRGCYDGDAIVLIQRDGVLYTCESSHCSCYGLEGTWDMVETSKEVLRKRTFYCSNENVEFLKFLEEFLKDGS